MVGNVDIFFYLLTNDKAAHDLSSNMVYPNGLPWGKFDIKFLIIILFWFIGGGHRNCWSFLHFSEATGSHIPEKYKILFKT